jgi:Transposase IS116/IS110/IS902 family
MWIADSLAHGLIKASFVPAEDFQERRSLRRTPQTAGPRADPACPAHAEVAGRGQHQARHGDLRPHGRERTTDDRSDDRRRTPSPQAGRAGRADHQGIAEAALRGLAWTPDEPHRFRLPRHLGQWDALDAAIRPIDQEVAARIARLDAKRTDAGPTFRELMVRLCGIPGGGVLSAISILAEMGRDRQRFPTASHLVSWAGLCPGQNESAGKRKSARPAQGRPVVDDHLGARRLGRQTQQQLRQGAVRSAAKPARTPEGLLRRGRLDPHRHLPYAEKTAPSITTSVPITSTAARPRRKPNAWSPSSANSALRCRCNPSPLRPNRHTNPSSSRSPRHHRRSGQRGFLLAPEGSEAIRNAAPGSPRALARLLRRDGDATWCGRRESNPHWLGAKGILSPLRLPVPPRPPDLQFAASGNPAASPELGSRARSGITTLSKHRAAPPPCPNFRPRFPRLPYVSDRGRRRCSFAAAAGRRANGPL